MRKILALTLAITMLFAIRNINGENKMLTIDTMINDIYAVEEDVEGYFKYTFGLLDFDLAIEKINWDKDENILTNIQNILQGILNIIITLAEFAIEFLLSPFTFLLPTIIRLIGIPLRWAGFIV